MTSATVIICCYEVFCVIKFSLLILSFVVTTPPKVILKDHTQTLVEVRLRCLDVLCYVHFFISLVAESMFCLGCSYLSCADKVKCAMLVLVIGVECLLPCVTHH